MKSIHVQWMWSFQLKICMICVFFSPKKEKNKNQDKIAEINKKVVVKIWETLKLKFFPRKKQNKNPIKGKKIIKWAIVYPLSLFILLTSIDPKFL